jgi:indoleamine 2,3-dioxygenase
MLQPHREFLKYLEGTANIREFVMQQRANIATTDIAESASAERSVAAWSLVAEYDHCVEQLRQFRSIHMKLVADYIVAQQRETTREAPSAQTQQQKSADAAQAAHPALAQPLVISRASLENSAGGRGTGGTDLLMFLRPIRDDCSAR